MDNSSDFLLRMEGIDKAYRNGVTANSGVDFRVRSGEIHGLLGENGAGKTTLMKVLYGLEEKDAGTITFRGERRNFSTPDEAIRAGIGMVHQHFRLADGFSVAENVVLGREPGDGLIFDRKGAIRETRRLAEEYGFEIDAEDRIADLSVGECQITEILRLLYQGAELLILDEPTAVLTPQETEALMDSLLELAEEGHTLIFITHKIDRALEASDVVSVMRDGAIVSERLAGDVSRQRVTELMVGREISLEVEKERASPGKPVFTARNLSARSEAEVEVVKDVSFTLYEGEIFGIAAVQGNGQSELVEVIAGGRRRTGGELRFRNRPAENPDPATVRDLGVTFIPEDRMEVGLAGEATVKENLTLPYANTSGYQKGGMLRQEKLAEKARELVDEYDIRVSSIDAAVESLSGGNAQKIVIAREFSQQPDLLLAAQPTRGLDIQTRRFVWDKLLELRSGGAAILLVSSDLPEVKALSDRLAVMYEGKIVTTFKNPDEVTEEEIGLYMMGVKKEKDSSREG